MTLVRKNVLSKLFKESEYHILDKTNSSPFSKKQNQQIITFHEKSDHPKYKRETRPVLWMHNVSNASKTNTFFKVK